MSARILRVDHEPLWREVVSHRLMPAGYQVHGAADDLVALDPLAPCAPDLVVSDVRRTDMDSYDPGATVRRDATLAGVAIVLMTAGEVTAPQPTVTPF
ncbi:MAG TPA: hypothetical protein VM536_06665, partial [Chloroflexia bacterium]|nr:hypothetical protein [Chloroflexia bacterium]